MLFHIEVICTEQVNYLLPQSAINLECRVICTHIINYDGQRLTCVVMLRQQNCNKYTHQTTASFNNCHCHRNHRCVVVFVACRRRRHHQRQKRRCDIQFWVTEHELYTVTAVPTLT